MGTHPIFESDFDCLTEMSRVILFSRELTCMRTNLLRVVRRTSVKTKKSPTKGMGSNAKPIVSSNHEQKKIEQMVQDTLLEETKSEINDSVGGSREPQRSPQIQQKKTDEQPSRSKKNRKKKVKNNLTEKQAEMELIRSKIIQGGRNDSSPPVQTNENATTKKQPKKPAKKTEGSPTTESITQKNKTDVSQELKPNESTNGKKTGRN